MLFLDWFGFDPSTPISIAYIGEWSSEDKLMYLTFRTDTRYNRAGLLGDARVVGTPIDAGARQIASRVPHSHVQSVPSAICAQLSREYQRGS